MRLIDIDALLEKEWKASAKLCKSSTPDSKLGASALSSCKSQGYRARDGKKSHTTGSCSYMRCRYMYQELAVLVE